MCSQMISFDFRFTLHGEDVRQYSANNQMSRTETGLAVYRSLGNNRVINYAREKLIQALVHDKGIRSPSVKMSNDSRGQYLSFDKRDYSLC